MGGWQTAPKLQTAVWALWEKLRGDPCWTTSQPLLPSKEMLEGLCFSNGRQPLKGCRVQVTFPRSPCLDVRTVRLPSSSVAATGSRTCPQIKTQPMAWGCPLVPCLGASTIKGDEMSSIRAPCFFLSNMGCPYLNDVFLHKLVLETSKPETLTHNMAHPFVCNVAR